MPTSSKNVIKQGTSSAVTSQMQSESGIGDSDDLSGSDDDSSEGIDIDLSNYYTIEEANAYIQAEIRKVKLALDHQHKEGFDLLKLQQIKSQDKITEVEMFAKST